MVIWLFGLSGAGKTTLAKGLHNILHNAILLDADDIRQSINYDLSYSLEDRAINIDKLSSLAKLLDAQASFVICTAITPLQSHRDILRQEIPGIRLVYVNCPLSICEKRDVKGLYEKARSGKIKDFTGIQSKFELPEDPDAIIDTHKHSIETSLQVLLLKLRI